MKTIRRALVCGAALGALTIFSACGAIEPKAEAPQTPGAPAEAAPTSLDATEEAEREPLNLADAEAMLEKARADLDRLALNDSPAASTAGASAAPAPAPAAAPPAPQRSEAQRAEKSTSEDGADRPQTKAANSCETACKAFSSLTRASDAVCRLDTDGGQRCERARKIREGASLRVASCGCAK